MSDIDYQTLRERYSPKPVPECSVCGEEMSIQRISGAHVVYACSGYGDDGDFKTGRTLADEHYEKSRVTVVDDNDPDVIALLDELEAAKSKLNNQRKYFEGVIADGSKRIAELEEIATDYALKFHKAQDALKYAVLMHNNSLSFEKEVHRRGTFTVQLPDPKEYFINDVFQPLRYERDVERAIMKAGGKVSWQEA
ncbi:ead/Ea22-like family protein [Escherichia marmotae]|uniref:ead/Ea22-like family protein n=1 Tax=Escherichia marmotae TaxID=1499973 RepID=UPI002E201B93|nr:ead/Ea22-like family protein [Escherichia marmotae]MED0605054.1 ead/Ea22-like family protein [Escherichia marmotae]